MVAKRRTKQYLHLVYCTASLALFVFLVGCSSMATRRGFYDPITAELRQSAYAEAAAKIEQAYLDNKYGRKDRFLYFLDAGLAHHYASNFDTSSQRLARAEETADDLYTKSISRAAASLLLNDNVLEYAGEDYEVLYTNLISALNYLALDQFDEAFVEIRRVDEKLGLLERKYAEAAAMYTENSKDDTAGVQIDYEAEKIRFYSDAFAHYLGMHMYAADGKGDDARIEQDRLRRAFETQPHIYSHPMPDVFYDNGDQAVLSVVALAGLGPTKEAFNLRIRTDKDLGLVQVLFTGSDGEESEYMHLPINVKADYYFKFSVPKVIARPSEVYRILVSVDGESIGDLDLLEDVAKVAGETFNARKSLIYLRSIGRAVGKGLATHKLKKKADTGGLAGWLKKAAIDVGSDLTENADLRCAQLLPGKIYVRDFKIEPGLHTVTVEFFDAHGLLIHKTQIDSLSMNRGGFNLVEAIALN